MPYSDSAEHAALVCRVLRIDPALRRQVVDEYERRLSGDSLAALREAWQRFSPHEAPLPAAPPSLCPMCAAVAVQPAIQRRSGETYGLCAHCGHGLLLSPPAGNGTYDAAGYYSQRTTAGVGYDAYLQEKDYREAKADRLLAWIEQTTGPAAGRSLLEVGSGFGFTRAAAERRGWRTTGIDLNPHAAAAARELYGFDTFTGTLEQALASEARRSDLLLYQFVLEHLADPVGELRLATASGAFLALLVPSMQAVERTVFGASYRSFRPDHLHLFSWDSLDRCLAAAGWTRIAGTSECTVHLLAGFLNPPELAELYRRGDGPDLLAVAQRKGDL